MISCYKVVYPLLTAIILLITFQYILPFVTFCCVIFGAIPFQRDCTENLKVQPSLIFQRQRLNIIRLSRLDQRLFRGDAELVGELCPAGGGLSDDDVVTRGDILK